MKKECTACRDAHGGQCRHPCARWSYGQHAGMQNQGFAVEWPACPAKGWCGWFNPRPEAVPA